MLFKRHILDRIARGEISTAFRVWRRPTVKAGGKLNTPVGELGIDAIRSIGADEITDEDARQSGAQSREELLAEIGHRDGQLYRIDFHLAGPDRHAALARKIPLAEAELRGIIHSLVRLDATSSIGASTMATLRLIEQHPKTAARELAAMVETDLVRFKRRVRQLKECGLTESLERGYRLTDRGQDLLRRWHD
jgi:hypothetical protein